MNKSSSNTTATPAAPAKPSGQPDPLPAGGTPLQPPEPQDESALESIGKAISAPVRDAAENEERKQVGGQRGSSKA